MLYRTPNFSSVRRDDTIGFKWIISFSSFAEEPSIMVEDVSYFQQTETFVSAGVKFLIVPLSTFTVATCGECISQVSS